uniref:HAT C-terminal dimerisation domain-containing protein n=1 Tax=Nothobranchius furzeri TaxID=105023 RepID=A0A8C6Q1A1_NOTFU
MAKCKTDRENRLNAKPLCLLCHKSLSVLKEYNILRHHTEKHQTVGAQFLEGTSERASKVQSLLASYNRSSSTIRRAFTAQEKATAASLGVSLILAKKKRPFTNSETVKECMLAVLDEVISDEKIKTSVTAAVKSVPLSDTSNIRRVEILAPVMSMAIDESTDKGNTAQLCVYVHFFDSDCARFREELLCLPPLKGRTTGEVFFDKISTFFQNNDLDMTRVCLLVTDGAPSIAGRINGLAMCWSAVAPGMKSLHLNVHQVVLSPKLSGHFKTVMDNVMATINFIRATSSLQHRLFRQLLSDVSAEHHELLQHNNVRWLSKGNSLECFWELRVDIEMFLHKCKQEKAEAHLNSKEVVSSIDEGQFLLELVGMQSSLTMPQELCTNGPAKFWSQINAHQFPNLKNVAVTVLSMFGSTYICEFSFSHMNAIKTNLHSSLTDSTLHYCLRIALCSYEPNIPFLVQNKKCPLWSLKYKYLPITSFFLSV